MPTTKEHPSTMRSAWRGAWRSAEDARYAGSANHVGLAAGGLLSLLHRIAPINRPRHVSLLKSNLSLDHNRHEPLKKSLPGGVLRVVFGQSLQ